MLQSRHSAAHGYRTLTTQVLTNKLFAAVDVTLLYSMSATVPVALCAEHPFPSLEPAKHCPLYSPGI